MSETSQTKLTLYRGRLDRGQYVWSPFVIKLEARLRFAGMPYTTEAGSVKSGPKGKIPYVEVFSETEGRSTPSVRLGDSTLIIKHLVERDVLPDLNARLDPRQRASDLGLRAMMEEKLWFYHGRERWTQNYYAMRDHILCNLPLPLRVAVGYLIYRNTVQTLHGQGTGRHTDDEIRVFRREIWEAVNDLLVSAKRGKPGDKPFWILGGEAPSEADATVYGFVVSVLICTACPESQELVRGFPAILEYADRIHRAYFPDYESFV